MTSRFVPMSIMRRIYARQHRLMHWWAPKNTQPGVNLIGPIHAANGLGTSMRGYARAIRQTGIPLNIIDWQRGFEHVDRIPFDSQASDHQSIGMQSINLVHLNFDLLLHEGNIDKPPLSKLITPNTYNIIIPFWELSRLKGEWREILHRFDEIWCASRLIAEAVKHTSLRKTHVVRPALDHAKVPAGLTRSDFDLPDERFIFFYCTDLNSVSGRKNPLIFLKSYLDEFSPGEGAFCLLKLTIPPYSEGAAMTEIEKLIGARADVRIISRTLPKEQMVGLFALSDCYVSPHRAEGLGLTILEAMQAAKPVIATPYGGPADFVNRKIAYPIAYDIVEVGVGHAPYPIKHVWAEPQLASLKGQMRHVFHHRAEAVAKGQKGARFVEGLFSLSRTSDDISRHVKRIWATHS